jgi:hypothetical protein
VAIFNFIVGDYFLIKKHSLCDEWLKKGNLRQNILVQKNMFCEMAKICHQFFLLIAYGDKSFTRVAALIAADGSAGEWRCAVGGFLARVLASLPCLRCVASPSSLRPRRWWMFPWPGIRRGIFPALAAWVGQGQLRMVLDSR